MLSRFSLFVVMPVCVTGIILGSVWINVSHYKPPTVVEAIRECINNGTSRIEHLRVEDHKIMAGACAAAFSVAAPQPVPASPASPVCWDNARYIIRTHNQ